MRELLFCVGGAICFALAYMATRIGSQEGKTPAQRRVAHGMIVAFNVPVVWALYGLGSMQGLAAAVLALFAALVTMFVAFYLAETTPFSSWWFAFAGYLGLLMLAAVSQQPNSLWSAHLFPFL